MKEEKEKGVKGIFLFPRAASVAYFYLLFP